MVFNRTVQGTDLNFYVSGVYRGMMIMSDTETHSYWDHITGECLAGYYLGERLPMLGSHELVLAADLVNSEPRISIAVPGLNVLQKFFTWFQNGHVWRRVPQGKFYPGFKESFEFEDNRRPEKELGLGVVEKGHARFYPLEVVKAHSSISDIIDGKQITVCVDRNLGIPVATFNDSIQRPTQLFMRWYGFAQTFRDCEIFVA